MYYLIETNQGLGAKQSFRVGLVSNFTLTGGTDAPHFVTTANGNDFDNSGQYSNGSYIFTVPSTGTYYLQASMKWTSNASGDSIEVGDGTTYQNSATLNAGLTRTDTFGWKASYTSGAFIGLTVRETNGSLGTLSNETLGTWWGIWY